MNWTQPEPLAADLPPVQAFERDLLPEVFGALAEDVADRMQTPLDFPGAAITLAFAGTVNRRAMIQPKELDAGWQVVPNLWGAIVAPPGFLKSPVIAAATRPLSRIEDVWRKEYEEAVAAHKLAAEEAELKRAAWKEKFKAVSKKGGTSPPRPEAAGDAPKARRLILNDSTMEALHVAMSENPAGVLVLRDELTGWLSQLDKPGREGERAFSLQAWNGDTGHTIDRIGRGTIHVPHCCLSLLGGIQPARLRSYLVDAVADGPGNDGLLQRFQLLVWPDIQPGWRYVDRPPDSGLECRAAATFHRVVRMDEVNPARFRFDGAAQEVFVDWLRKLEEKIRAGDLHPALTSHLGKYRSMMPSLALLGHLAEAATGGRDPGETVGALNAERAVRWCSYLESHARRVYQCVTTPQLRAARELSGKIKARKVGASGEFSCREVYLKGWSGLDSPEAVQAAAEVLKDAGWLRDHSPETGPSGGRPAVRYLVNPLVHRASGDNAAICEAA